MGTDEDQGASGATRRPTVYLSFAALDAELVAPIVAAIAERIDCDLLTIDTQQLRLPPFAAARLLSTVAPTDRWKESSSALVDAADLVLSFVSPGWVRSAHTAEEARVAAKSEKLALIAIRPFDVRILPTELRSEQRYNLEQGDPEQLALLTRDLARRLERSAAPPDARPRRTPADPPKTAPVEAAEPVAPAGAPDPRPAAASPPEPEPDGFFSAMRKAARTSYDSSYERSRARSEKATIAFRQRLALRRAVIASRLRRAWRQRWRALPHLLVGFAALLAAGCVLAALTFADLGRRESAAAPVLRDVAGNLSLETRAQAATVARDGTPVGTVAGHAAPIVAGLLAADGRAVTLDEAGTVRTTGWTAAALRIDRRFAALGEAVRLHAWVPFWRPVGRFATDWTARILPLSPPAAIAGGRLRSFRDCADCPEMVALKPAWLFVGSPWETLPDASVIARRLVQVPNPIAVMQSPVTAAEYRACVAAAACPANAATVVLPVVGAAQAARYAAWLSARTRRAYRVPTRAELTYVVAGGETSRPFGLSGTLRAAYFDCGVAGGRTDAVTCRPESGTIRLVASTGSIAGTEPAPPRPGADSLSGRTPLIYIQVSTAAQQAEGAALAARLGGRAIAGASLAVAADIDVVAGPRASALRCFTASECSRAAPLLAAINGELTEPVTLQDMSANYSGARPRADQYELWFSARPLGLRGGAATR